MPATLPAAALVLGLLLRAGPVAQEPAPADKSAEALQDQESVTIHSVRIAGQEIAYTATAGTLVLREEDGEAKASVFYVAYTRNGVDDLSRRPLTFSFNGGPGSSSVWLHLGVFGPRRVVMGEPGALPKPPYELVDNEYSLLDHSDFVFIDPVTTGYSRAAPEEDDGQFHGLREDVESVAEFIRLYVTRNERWASPKFLAGESYGTTRAAGLSDHLQSRHGMYLNGIVLVSSILNFGTARFDRGNDLPYVLFLPTYTATAWYHGQLDPELQQDLRRTLDRVEDFALDDYARALLHGDRLPAAERDEIVRELARFTGLSEEYVEQARMRIDIGKFCKELRRDESVTVGRLDSRFTGRDYDDTDARYEFDPSYAAIQGPYTATLNHYLRSELAFESDLPYEILTGRVRPWSFAAHENRYVNVAEDLRQAMTQNRDLRVFVASGYYDLATPYFATEYTFDHLGLDPGLRDQVTMAYYESGHMMYIHLPSLAQMREDLVAFLDAAASG